MSIEDNEIDLLQFIPEQCKACDDIFSCPLALLATISAYEAAVEKALNSHATLN